MKKIKFAPEFIALILSGEKTQTRRPIKDIDAVFDIERYQFKNGAGWHPSNQYEDIKSIEEITNEYSKYKNNNIITFIHQAKEHHLKIISVKVERLQNIEDDDISLHKEGIRSDIPNMLSEPSRKADKARKFKEIWNTIYSNKCYEWNVNPWVWVYSFERVEG
jgi:hypothetical protein